MKTIFVYLLVVALFVARFPIALRANPDLYSFQPVAGLAESSWSFMTAWNLSTGHLEISPTFYNERSVWFHSAPKLQWIGRFIYDQSSGQTAELAWYYGDWFVQ